MSRINQKFWKGVRDGGRRDGWMDGGMERVS